MSTRCPTCSGQDGAHYFACTVAAFLSRFMPEGYPMSAPAPLPPEMVPPTANEREKLLAHARDAGIRAADPSGYIRRRLDRAGITWEQMIEDIGEGTSFEERLDYAAVKLAEFQGAELAARIAQAAGPGVTVTATPASPAEVQAFDTVVEAFAGASLLDEARASVALDRDQTHVVGEPTPPAPKTTASSVGDELRAATELFVSEFIVPAEPRDYVTSPQLADAYRAWRPTIDAPEANPMREVRALGVAMRGLGYRGRQDHRISGADGKSRPQCYFGVQLKPSEPARSEPEPEAKAETPADYTTRIREIAQKARHASAVVIDKGDRPGRELVDDTIREYARVLVKEQGWTYYKNNANSGGKPRIINPEGKSLTLPNTPSDFRASKNTRAQLRRMGANL